MPSMSVLFSLFFLLAKANADITDCSWKSASIEQIMQSGWIPNKIGDSSTKQMCRVTGGCSVCACPNYVQYSTDNGVTWQGYTFAGTIAPHATGCVFTGLTKVKSQLQDQINAGLCGCTAPAPERWTVHATCDNIMKLYADGVLVASKSTFETTFSTTLDKQPTVLAVACEDLHVVGGILLSASNSLRTDASWRCSNTYRAGWTQAGFDDSAWTSAYEIGANGMSPWGARYPNIAADAKWIWTGQNTWQGQDRMVYCRKTLKPIVSECSWKGQTGTALLELSRWPKTIGQLSTGKKCRVTSCSVGCACPYYVQYSNDNGATWLGYTFQGTPGGTGCVFDLGIKTQSQLQDQVNKGLCGCI